MSIERGLIYVGNSPLNFTDPSGYCFAGCFWQKPFKALGGALRRIPVLGNILTVAAAALCGPAAGPCAGMASSITSAVVTGLASGDIGQALKAGFITAVTAIASFQVGELTSHGPLDFLSGDHVLNIAGHAAVGCGSAVASGGDCGPGALSGAVGSFTSHLPFAQNLSRDSKLIFVSVSGGLSSVAGGGKFGNGAVTAAFGYLFNELGNSQEQGYPATSEATTCSFNKCLETGYTSDPTSPWLELGATGALVGRIGFAIYDTFNWVFGGPQTPASIGRGLDDILRNEKLFNRWLKSSHNPNRPLSLQESRQVWDKLNQSGMKPRLDAGHPGTTWNKPHINIEGRSTHIPVHPKFKP